MNEVAETFSRIYESRSWDSTVLSGPGSRKGVNRRYIRFVQRLIDSGKFRSVLDIGCGDWTIGSCLNWRNVEYLGVDVVASVIENNRENHARRNVHFECLDFLNGELPPADLVIIKDVLQHLPTESVVHGLRILASYPVVLATNDCDRLIRYWKWGCIPRSAPHGRPPNCDVAFGGYRPLRLNQPPFEWEAKLQFRYQVPISDEVFDIKEVLLKQQTSC